MVKKRFLSTLVVAAVAALATVSAAYASAPTTGPVWHVGGSPLASGTSFEIAGALKTGTEAKVYGKFGASIEFRINCTQENLTGSAVITGPKNGSGTIEVAGCTLYVRHHPTESYALQKGCEIKPGKGKATVELWYEGEISGASHEIMVIYTPTVKNRLIPIEIVSVGKEECPYAGIYYSEGDVGAMVRPAREEVLTGELKSFSTQVYHGYRPATGGGYTEITLEPMFDGQPDRLEAEGTAHLTSGKEFGVWES